MKNKKISALSIKIALLVLVISFLGIAIISYFSYSQAKKIFIEHTAEIIAKNVVSYKSEIQNNVNKLKDNVQILTYNPSTKGFFRAYMDKYKYDEKTNRTFGHYKSDIITIMSLMMNQNPSYFQIRILDKNGKEILKLVKDKGKIIQIKDEQLQNKRHRIYFIESMKIGSGIYISNINLNKEFNKLEFPLRPTIRIAKAVYVDNKKVGIVVINANIKSLFDFEKFKRQDIQTFITNQKGDYLLNYKDPVKEFGFEFGRDFKIYYDFPELKKLYFSKQELSSYISDKYIIEARKLHLCKHKYLVIVKVADISLFKKKAQNYLHKLILFIIVVSLSIAFLTTILVKRLTRPIEKLTTIAREIAENKGKSSYDIKIDSNDEIGELAKAFEIMLKSLAESKKEIETFALSLEEEVNKKTEELQKINQNLQHLVEEKVNEIRDKDKMLLQQSKMAAMGEMIGAIAHQWRQPLNSLGLNIQLLQELYENNELSSEKLEEFVEKNMQTIQFMSQTIDDFRNFFRKDKEKVEFSLKDVIEKTINLQKAQLEDHNIKITSNLDDLKITGYKNEFMQVILNLVSNAKDAILERREKINEDFEGKIEIEDRLNDNVITIIVRDNGGGIPDEIKDRIFEPYFTTKEEGKGTGIGLYMVKEIVERMNGLISFHNITNGTEFVLKFRVGGGVI